MLAAGAFPAAAGPDPRPVLSVDDARARGISVWDPWVRLPVSGVDTTAVYFVLENRSAAPLRLVGAASPVAAAAELHEVVEDADGVMRMRPLPAALSVLPGRTEVFRPGGRHIMLIGLRQILSADAPVPLILRFADGISMAVQAPVRLPAPDGPHGRGPRAAGEGHRE